MSNKNIEITIGITAFNEHDLLSEAWNSVLNQTMDNWGAVMVLDGGGDQRTKKYFETIQHPRLTKYSYNINQGIYKCRSKAIELADTEWYFHLDADDLLPSNAIELVLNTIKENPDAEYIAGACNHFGLEKSKVIPQVRLRFPLMPAVVLYFADDIQISDFCIVKACRSQW